MKISTFYTSKKINFLENYLWNYGNFILGHQMMKKFSP